MHGQQNIKIFKKKKYLAMFKMRCGIPNAYILDIIMYKMHVSLCSCFTIRIRMYRLKF